MQNERLSFGKACHIVTNYKTDRMLVKYPGLWLPNNQLAGNGQITVVPTGVNYCLVMYGCSNQELNITKFSRPEVLISVINHYF
jgi:hypothetical protein